MAFEGLRDRWEHWTPRERRLMALLGVALVAMVAIVIARQISGGLERIEAGNEKIREALVGLDVLQANRHRQSSAPKVEIPDEPLNLPVFLEGIASEVGVTIPNFPTQAPVPHGSYTQHGRRIEIRNLTLQQLADFLEKVEQKPLVVVTELKIDGNRREPDKLSRVTMTVATYAKAAPAAKPGNEG